jgi:murein DD-endopeptidase MepM/ murein hydrolase activator NlpD
VFGEGREGFMKKYILTMLLLATLLFVLLDYLKDKCDADILSKQNANLRNQIKSLMIKNKQKDLRIDTALQLVSNIAEEMPAVGAGLEEVLINIKDNRTIGIDQKLADLPDDMASLIIEQNIEAHGLKNYRLYDGDYIFPVEATKAYIPSRWGEFGWRPKLFDETTYEYVYSPKKKVKVWKMHGANDMLNPYQPEVFAVEDGKVIKVDTDKKGGLYVIIEHRIKGKPLRRTKSFHLAKTYVEIGDEVKQGQVIGLIGQSGRMVTSKHLHFEFIEWDGRRWVVRNFLRGTTHNRRYTPGYYWLKNSEGKWYIKTL